ncbi:cytochrome c biogenesis protein CcsA [Nonomuraea sp. NPDC049309]|uniref:cytochrome c biogenesis protein CcsA n=1 Tax=Nonomuraea sp. NPDC049309 TaxID=3364350 RepID=UPI003716D141
MSVEINPFWAMLSDQLVLVAVLAYLGAMLGYAVELAFRPVSIRASEPSTLALAHGRDRRAGLAAVILLVAGWAANLGAVLARGLAAARWPWGNMYEFVVAICLAMVTAFLLLRARSLGAFVAGAAALGLGYAVLSLQIETAPVMPALNTYWIAIHVSAAVIASGLFMVAALAGAVALARRRGELAHLAHRAILIGFPIWTFAVIAGAMWADKAWGRYWGWDPKEIWAFITWIGYAAYLHAYATAGWRGRNATIVQLAAFVALLFNLIGVNLWIPGLHSYADVPT